MNGELKIKIKIEFKDFLNFQFWISRKRFIRPFIYIVFFLLLPSIISFLLYGSFSFLLGGAMLTPIIVFLLLPIFLCITIYYSSKKSYENDPFIQKGHELTINSSGFTSISENSNTTLTWNDIYKYIESPKNILVYCSPTKAVIIPKRCLSEIEVSDLKVFLFSNVVSKEKNTFFNSRRIVSFSIILIAIGVGVWAGLSKSSTTINYFNEGNLKIRKGDFAGSIIDFDNAIKQNSSYSMAYAYRGYAKEMQHNYQEAIRDCMKAIELDARNDWAYYYMGYAKYEAGDSIGGCNDYSKAANWGNKSAKEDMRFFCK